MSEDKVRQIVIYRRDIDTPISVYDKSSIDDKDFVQMMSNVFSSPNISIINTSSGQLIIRPSRLDAIEILDIEEDSLSEKLDIVENENEIEEKSITEEIEFDEEIIVEEITIDNVSINETKDEAVIDE